MKVIFLDIDGVLKEDKQGAPFLDESLSLLKSTVEAAGAVLVMSSSWKVKYKAFLDDPVGNFNNDISLLYNALTRQGLCIHDCTPLMREVEKAERRPAEIMEYLNLHSDIESFCIIDDRTEFNWGDLAERLALTFIGTDESGEKLAHLTKETAEKAVGLLNTPLCPA